MAKRKKTEGIPENMDDTRKEGATLPDATTAKVSGAQETKTGPSVETKPAEAVALKEAPMEAPKGDGRPKVSLKVFIASGGIRWDQMAGFKSYALRQKMGPLSIPEWREAYNQFSKRPV